MEASIWSIVYRRVGLSFANEIVHFQSVLDALEVGTVSASSSHQGSRGPKINYAACTLGEVPSRSDITQVSQESETKDQNQSALSAGYSGLQIYDKAVIRPVEYDECSCNRPHSVQTVSFRLAFLHGRLLERLLTQSRFPVLAPTAVQSR